jgi:hypothetical protein
VLLVRDLDGGFLIGASSGSAVTSESGTMSSLTLYSESSKTFAIISRSSALISGLSPVGSLSMSKRELVARDDASCGSGARDARQRAAKPTDDDYERRNANDASRSGVAIESTRDRRAPARSPSARGGR